MKAGWNEYKDIKETLKGLIEKGYTVSMIHQVLEQNFIDDVVEQTPENPIKHFGSIECPNCGQLLTLEEQPTELVLEDIKKEITHLHEWAFTRDIILRIIDNSINKFVKK